MLTKKLPTKRDMEKGFGIVKRAINGRVAFMDTSYFSPPYDYTPSFREKGLGHGVSVFYNLAFFNACENEDDIREVAQEAERYIRDYHETLSTFLGSEIVLPDPVVGELKDRCSYFKYLAESPTAAEKSDGMNPVIWKESLLLRSIQYTLSSEIMGFAVDRNKNRGIGTYAGGSERVNIITNLLSSKRRCCGESTKGVDEFVVAVAASACLDGHGATILTKDRSMANDVNRLYRECERHPFRDDFQAAALYRNMKEYVTGINVLFFSPNFNVHERAATRKIRR